MKRNLLTTIAAAMLTAVSARAAVLVNLDATTLTDGPLATWTNTGSLAGNFTSGGSVVPVVGDVTPGAGGGIVKKAVTFASGTTFYVGPVSPAGITGAGARSIEVWALNPDFYPEEGLVSWGRRGGPDFTNCSFGYGSHGTWGSLGGWGAGDMNWGTVWGAFAATAGTPATTGAPTANHWHHLVYTYNGTTAIMYADAVAVNTQAKAFNTYAGFPICLAAQVDGGTLLPIGGNYTGANTFASSLSMARVRVHDTALSAVQVRTQYVAEYADFGKAAPVLAPIVTAFSPATPNIVSGGSATLAWNIYTDPGKDLTGLTITASAPALANTGSVVVSPATTTTYTLMATNADGVSTATLTVNVLAPSPLVPRHRWSFNEPAAAGTNGAALADSVGGQNAFIRMSTPAKAVATGTGITLSGGSPLIAPYIDLPNGMASARTGGATYEGWVSIAATQNQARLFDFGNSQTNNGQEIIRPGGTGNGLDYFFLSASVGTTATQSRVEILDGTVVNGVTATVTFTANAEFHYVVVYHPTGSGSGGPQFRYYRNGAQVATLDTALLLSNIFDNNCFLGRSAFAGDNNLQGTYNEFRVYDGPMTAVEVAASSTAGANSLTTPAAATIRHRWSFNEPAGTLEADTPLADSVGGATAYVRSVDTKLTGSQVLISGGTTAQLASYIDLPNGIVSARTGDATYEGWATLHAISNWGRLMDLGSSLANGGVEITGTGNITGNGNEYFFIASHNGAPTAIDPWHPSSCVLRDGTVEQGQLAWVPFTPHVPVHFAATYRKNGGSTGGPGIRYYRNGVLYGQIDTTYLLPNILDNNCWLGRSQYMGDSNVNGSYDEFRVYDGALSDEDMAASYQAGPNAALQTPLHVDMFAATRTTIQAGESSELVWQISNPGGGSLSVFTTPASGVSGTTGTVTVSPPATTTYTLTAKAGGQTRQQLVTITVTPLAPTVTERTWLIPYQTGTAVTLAGIDPRSLALTWTVLTPPVSGLLTGTAPNLTYTPNAGFSGTDSMVVRASNGFQTDDGTIGLYIQPDAPVAGAQAVEVAYQTARPITLVATDPDNDPVTTWTIVTPPALGVLSGTAPNLTYTPNAGAAGADSFTFTAGDGTFTSAAATVSILIHAATAPTNIILSDSSIKTDDTAGTMIARLQAINGSAPEGLTYTLVAGTGDTNNGDFTIVGNQLLSNHNYAADLGLPVSVRLRVTDSTGLSYEKVFTFTVGAPDLHVKINEIHYNTPDNTIAGEFIELYNPLSTAVNVENWRFTSGVTYTIPAGTPDLAPGGYLVIAENPAILQALYGYAGALGPWTGGLSSDGDTITLRDAANVKVDEVSFGVNTPWPTSPNGDGPSLELINPALDNDLGGHWRAATVTPPATTYIAKGTAGWSYRPGLTEASSPITAWTDNAFVQDASWRAGTAPIGLFKVNNNTALATLGETGAILGTQLTAAVAGTEMATFGNATVGVINNFTVAYQSVFFRRQFNIAGTPPSSLFLRIMRNDAAIVWINGVQVGRFGFSPTAPANPPANYDFAYELGNDPWMQTVLTNLAGVLTTGTNTIAVQGFAKKPRLRGNPDGQEVAGTAGSTTAVSYNIFDFAIDAELSTVGSYKATPGAQNSVFAANAAPAVRNVEHSPQMPAAGQPITVTARISDRQGIGSATLKYQLNSAASFIPAELPRTNAEITANIIANPDYPKLANSDYELAANWTSVSMVDDGRVAGDTAGDGVFTAIIPAQAHRTLVRYRVFATDIPGATSQYPNTDDSQKNFALFVYNGVPAWSNTGVTFSPAQLSSLPVYQMMMRSADFDRLLAYTAADQFANDAQLATLLARRYYNFECVFVYDGKVYDHVQVRLRGGNSRYLGAGKRHFRFKFPKGYPFMAKDNKGNFYPRPWGDMLFNKMYGNKGSYDWGLSYEAGVKLWGLSGVPMPEHHWIHFRVVRTATEAPAATTGDFWGLYDALELPEGKDFLKARDLPEGNFYKMSDFIQNGEMDERYQAQGAVQFAEDFENVRFNTHQFTPRATMESNIDMPNYYAYNAVQEAIRHYDIFVEPTGRHRIKNLYWWFRPSDTNPLGQCVFMPYDWDAAFGASFNGGRDLVQNALYNYDWIPDSPTWPNAYGTAAGSGAMPDRSPMLIQKRNAIRHLRDLVFYRDSSGTGPMDDILNDGINTIGADMAAADTSRWPTPGAASYLSLTAKAADMLKFCFTGWNTIAGEPVVAAGGRAVYMDSISDGIDAGQLPATPAVTYSGTAGYPVDGLTFMASAFSDPQGGTFAAIQWRAGEVAAPTLTEDRIYEAAEVWGSGELAGPATSIAIPGGALRAGHTYRVRVRYEDVTGRFGHWSAPLEFTAAEGTYDTVLTENLYISELMYKPAPPTAAQASSPNFWTESDFEYVELTNRSTLLTLDLTNVRFTKGVDFDFLGSAITSLAPGGSVLVVRNIAAFTNRYGAGKPIAGAWDAGQNLSNSGEQLKLSYGAGNAIHDITYDDAAPWPDDADNGGVSMVYFGPNAVSGNPDPQNTGGNWTASSVTGGSPGTEEFYAFSRWMSAHGLNDPSGDDFQTGWDNLATFAFGRDLRLTTPTGGIVEVGPDRFLDYTYTRRQGAVGVTYHHEVSSTLAGDSWSDANVVTTSVTSNGDGTEKVMIRLALSVDDPGSGTRWFIRSRAEFP